MGQNPSLPVYRGEIQSYHLGCDIDCVDEEGRSVLNERGELIVRSAFPSMPTKFHNDHDGVLYQKAYFSKYKGVWAHGDYMKVDSVTRGIVMLGRSDATLNPSGVRFGSSEIYQIGIDTDLIMRFSSYINVGFHLSYAVERFAGVADSVCIGQRNKAGTDERVLLLLKLDKDAIFDDTLVNGIKKAIREHLSPRHVPALIMEVKDIPVRLSTSVELCEFFEQGIIFEFGFAVHYQW